MEYVRAVALRRCSGAYSFHDGWAGGRQRQHHVSACGGRAGEPRAVPVVTLEGN